MSSGMGVVAGIEPDGSTTSAARDGHHDSLP
jgi:hypothetical protein